MPLQNNYINLAGVFFVKNCNGLVLAFGIMSTTLMTGCASIVSSGSQDITIDSFPQGATISLNV